MREVSKNGYTFIVEEIHEPNFEYWSQFTDGSWEPETFRAIDSFVKPGTTYVDIGAWVGPTVLYAAQLAASVVAFEPDPTAFGSLVNNIARNGITNVTALQMAVSDHAGTANLAAPEGWGYSMSSLVRQSDRSVSVSTTTLEKILRDLENVSLVKIDIEGGEVLALPPAINALKERRIPVYLAVHGPWLANHQMDVLREALAAFGRLSVKGNVIEAGRIVGWCDVLCEWT